MGRQPDSPRPAGLPKVGIWESGADTSGDWHPGTGYGGTVTDVYIGWWGLAASLVPLLVVVGISAGRRLGLERDLVVATVRAVAQLVLAGWALTLLLDEGTSIIWAWAWVAASAWALNARFMHWPHMSHASPDVLSPFSPCFTQAAASTSSHSGHFVPTPF